MHAGEVTTSEDSTAPSDRSSIGAHVSEVAKHKFWPALSVEDLLGAHPINDAIWGRTDPSDVSIDTVNSADIMTCSHIREEQTFIFRRSDPHELLNVVAHMPRKDDLSWYDGPDFLDNHHGCNKSPNVIDTVNSAENITGAHVPNQEHLN